MKRIKEKNETFMLMKRDNGVKPLKLETHPQRAHFMLIMAIFRVHTIGMCLRVLSYVIISNCICGVATVCHAIFLHSGNKFNSYERILRFICISHEIIINTMQGRARTFLQSYSCKQYKFMCVCITFSLFESRN